MNRPILLTKPPNEIVTATICDLTQVHVEQIDAIWRDILREAQQPDVSWDWAYKLRQALGDSRYEAYGIELDGLVQGVVLLETQWHRSWLPQRPRVPPSLTNTDSNNADTEPLPPSPYGSAEPT